MLEKTVDIEGFEYTVYYDRKQSIGTTDEHGLKEKIGKIEIHEVTLDGYVLQDYPTDIKDYI